MADSRPEKGGGIPRSALRLLFFAVLFPGAAWPARELSDAQRLRQRQNEIAGAPAGLSDRASALHVRCRRERASVTSCLELELARMREEYSELSERGLRKEEECRRLQQGGQEGSALGLAACAEAAREIEAQMARLARDLEGLSRNYEQAAARAIAALQRDGQGLRTLTEEQRLRPAVPR